MKKITFILALFFVCSSLLAHNIDNKNSNMELKHWHLIGAKHEIHASFYMYKDGKVSLEDEQHNILNFPLTSFNDKDKKFVLEKYEKIKEINAKLIERNNIANGKVTEFQNLINTEHPAENNINYFLLFTVLIAVTILVYNFTDRAKLKFVYSFIGIGILFTIYSFTTGDIKFQQSATNPLTIDSAFKPFKPNVYTRWDANYFYVESKGIPNHSMMTGIVKWQQQVPIPQCYIGTNAWQVPLNPVIAPTPVPVNPQHFIRGAVAIAANGVPIFNPYTNTGVDAYLDGQLDNWGGHSGRADDYHYHIAPLILYTQTLSTLPIAYALDGFPIYGSNEPNGTPMTTLDSNHGHYWTNGVYHYHGTMTAPYMIGRMVGRVTEDTTLQIVPQPSAHPVRPSLTPLTGAVITGFAPNGSNGYNLTYTLSGQTYGVNYSWTQNGQYTYNFVSPTGTTTSNYTGFTQCTVPSGINENGNSAIPKSYNMLWVYPNPFNPTVSINYNLAKSSNVQIKIFDASGKQISVVTEKFQTAGEYNAVYNSQTNSSGVFYLTLSIDGSIADTKKLVLLK